LDRTTGSDFRIISDPATLVVSPLRDQLKRFRIKLDPAKLLVTGSPVNSTVIRCGKCGASNR
jgi:hypothetical protein